ncbi:hypothetical protein [Antarcticirhabdus aurantiaca]|uniref:Uncharacterized protein n=1 Tax=Antarcticirhabdus aurantiaca TaxID=2606717 RepID=A0ACD4NPB7_9HYPH|nr:hypothetical protein [Antarcticirhabdus aurantiaca]WAJ28648.1 hypothetical protein OXU80_28275 [Jeongeuplla avenae]
MSSSAARRRLAALLTLVLPLCGGPVLAQSGISLNEGDGPEPVCLSSTRFAVEAQWRADDSGSDILIRAAGPGALPPAGEPCRYEPRAGDRILSSRYPDEALTVSALSDRFLVMEASTGPQSRLIVADLDADTNALVADDIEIEAVTGEGVDYWATEEGADPSACPDYAETLAAGLTPVIDARWFFSFAAGTSEKRSETRCSAVQ